MASEQPGATTGTFDRAGRGVSGTMSLDAGPLSGIFAVAGALRGPRALLRGAFGARRFRWQARWNAKKQIWRGPMLVRDGKRRMRALVALGRDGAGGGGPGAPACGNDYFASDVMPSVMQPICATCHVPAGLAKAAAFRVTAGDALATATSALAQVDFADPASSRLLAKPTGAIAHGGGKQIQPGSTQEQILTTWIGLVTAPGCGVAGGGGGPGPGPGGGTGADLYTTNCASCHGADARGLDGRPDIRCNHAIADSVRKGRTGGPSGDMPAFTLTDAEIALIQAYLSGLCPATSSGDDLYTANCASCHGADGRGLDGRPSIRCNRAIAEPVRNGRTGGPWGDMPAFTFTDAEIALLQTYLLGLCPVGSGGDDLYASNCATCHGPDAGGTSTAPSVRCATLVADAVTVGRGARMPAFPALAPLDVTSIETWLDARCTAAGRTGSDLYAGNCSSCHGATAAGGRNGLGQPGPDIRCTEALDYSEKIRFGEEGMPAFPRLDATDVTAIVSFVHGTFCPGG